MPAFDASTVARWVVWVDSIERSILSIGAGESGAWARDCADFLGPDNKVNHRHIFSALTWLTIHEQLGGCHDSRSQVGLREILAAIRSRSNRTRLSLLYARQKAGRSPPKERIP